MRPGHSSTRDLLPTVKNARAVQDQGLWENPEARVFANRLCLPVVEPGQTGSSVQQGVAVWPDVDRHEIQGALGVDD